MLRILLVEDNASIVDNLQAMLEDLTQARVIAVAAEQKLACAWMDARTNGCDVAIIDVFLKAGNGLGVLEHMAGYDRPPQRVVLTNYATSDMRSRCRALGADAVFDKSTEIDDLVQWLVTNDVRH